MRKFDKILVVLRESNLAKRCLDLLEFQQIRKPKTLSKLGSSYSLLGDSNAYFLLFLLFTLMNINTKEHSI